MKVILLVLMLLVSGIGYSQDENPEDSIVANVNNVINLFEQKNIDGISGIIDFPLSREYPIPNIIDEKEFRQRFNEVFDEVLIDRIANSNPEQWSDVGWRGIMLDNGIVWMDSYEGKIIAVNYQSDFEIKFKNDLIEKEKQSLHTSLKIFENPKYRIKTENYLVRIDELSNNKYRFASWKTGKKESSKPDLILENGQLEFQGSGGNHIISFLNENYTYRVYRNLLAEEDSPEITFEIEKNGETLVKEDGALIAGQ